MELQDFILPTEGRSFVSRHKKGRKIFVRASVFLYSQLPEGGVGGKGYEIPEALHITQEQANELFGSWADFSARRQEKGEGPIRIRVQVSTYCIFIG